MYTRRYVSLDSTSPHINPRYLLNSLNTETFEETMRQTFFSELRPPEMQVSIPHFLPYHLQFNVHYSITILLLFPF